MHVRSTKKVCTTHIHNDNIHTNETSTHIEVTQAQNQHTHTKRRHTKDTINYVYTNSNKHTQKSFMKYNMTVLCLEKAFRF